MAPWFSEGIEYIGWGSLQGHGEAVIPSGWRPSRVSALGSLTPPLVTLHPCSVSEPNKLIGELWWDCAFVLLGPYEEERE